MALYTHTNKDLFSPGGVLQMVSVRPKHIFYDMTQVVSSLDTNNVAITPL